MNCQKEMYDDMFLKSNSQNSSFMHIIDVYHNASPYSIEIIFMWVTIFRSSECWYELSGRNVHWQVCPVMVIYIYILSFHIFCQNISFRSKMTYTQWKMSWSIDKPHTYFWYLYMVPDAREFEWQIADYPCRQAFEV